MTGVPDAPNFYSVLHTHLSREQIAALYGTLGWQVRKSSWTDYEVATAWAELVIESESPVLMHGTVADVATNAERVLAPLREAGVGFTAESYGPGGELLREWQVDAPTAGA